jgi:cell wall-associated NlpC family hydrolase
VAAVAQEAAARHAAAAAAAAQQAAQVASALGGTGAAAAQAANEASAAAGGPTVGSSSTAPAAGGPTVGSSSTAPAAGGPTVGFSSTATAAGQAAVRAAESQLGVPYVWGGETPGVGFDCSGLVQWSWAQAGVSIPRTSQEQFATVPHVPMSDIQPGDLLFYFNLDGTGTVDHVVMYVGSGPYGNQTVIQAPYTGATVSYDALYTYGLVAVGQP